MIFFISLLLQNLTAPHGFDITNPPTLHSEELHPPERISNPIIIYPNPDQAPRISWHKHTNPSIEEIVVLHSLFKQKGLMDPSEIIRKFLVKPRKVSTLSLTDKWDDFKYFDDIDNQDFLLKLDSSGSCYIFLEFYICPSEVNPEDVARGEEDEFPFYYVQMVTETDDDGLPFNYVAIGYTEDRMDDDQDHVLREENSESEFTLLWSAKEKTVRLLNGDKVFFEYRDTPSGWATFCLRSSSSEEEDADTVLTAIMETINEW